MGNDFGYNVEIGQFKNFCLSEDKFFQFSLFIGFYYVLFPYVLFLEDTHNLKGTLVNV